MFGYRTHGRLQSNTRARNWTTGGTLMTLIHTVSPRIDPRSQARAHDVRRSVTKPGQAPRYGGAGRARPRQIALSRPAGTPVRYRGTGVARSVAPHRRRPVTLMTTIGLALGAGLITLWLGLVANLGQALNGESAGTASHVPDRLAVVRGEPGEALQEGAAGGGPGAAAS